MAVAEQLSAIDTETYCKERAARANMKEFWKLMNRKGGQPAQEDDALPEGCVSLKYPTQNQACMRGVIFY